MYTVIRKYTDASALIDEMARRPNDVERVITNIPGFIAYHAIRDGSTLVTVSICQDSRGADETTREAAKWVRENLPAGSVAPPEITVGDAFLSFGSASAAQTAAAART